MRNSKRIQAVSIISILLLLAGCAQSGTVEKDNVQGTGNPAEEQSQDALEGVPYLWDVHTTSELITTDYLLYNVNCAGPASDTVLGLYQSVPDQELGVDVSTGKQWGYRASDYMEAVVDNTGEGLTGYRWEIQEGIEYDDEETGFYYDFEVPSGEYEVTLGFYNPYSARPVSAVMEGELVVEDQKILRLQLIQTVSNIRVTDGMLNVKVYNPGRGTDVMRDPVLSFIVVKAVPEYTRELLEAYMAFLADITENENRYIASTFIPYQETYKAAKDLLDKENNETEEYREAYLSLKEAYENLEEIMVYTSFLPGEKWTDDEGNLIQAHGGQVQRLSVPDPVTGVAVEKWWWVGEDKTNGSSRSGICAYSSDDLYNWHFEGIVMRNVESREQLDEEEYFRELYGDYSKEQKDNVYLSLDASSAIIERPKLIYNEKTGMYVLWFHADGPTAESNSSYAAACAGVAVSETPYGPFKFIDRYRLNTCPKDQEDFYPQSRGMARDMNLFVDEDGTAYIIYSSEENLTLYISRLNEEYTYLDTAPEDAVYGRDFIRLFPGAQREAPALFVRNGVYYLMTSGCTGWAPNQARYYRADSVLGDWVNCGDPCVGDTNLTTFESQSTCIFKVGEDNYVYMGDRWNSEDLKNSRYIWLPVTFDDEGNMSLHYEEEWSY